MQNNEEYSGFDLTMYNLFTLLREMYYTRGETETNFLQKSGGVLSGSLTIQGNLVINGQSYSIDTENLKVGDYTITLAKDNEQTLTSMVGMVVPKYDGTNYGFFGWDADGYAYVGDLTDYDGSSAITLANNSSLQRISTIDTTNTVVASNGVIYVYDATSHCFKKPTNDNKYYVIRNGAFVETELFTEQKSKNIDNALYNIGAFDTISGNTITRQTGIIILDEQNWNYLTDYDRPRYEITLSTAVLPSNNDVMPSIVCNNYTVRTPNDAWGQKNGVSLDPNAKLIVYGTTKPSGKLEYKLSSTYQYQEQIIENQPLLTLNQDGCNWLQKEWEKGLNLLPNSHNLTVHNANVFFDVNIEAGKTYTFSIQGGTNSGAYALWLDMNGTNVQSITDSTGADSSKTFTATANATKLGFYPNNIVNANIMLNLGTHSYPYEPPYGAIVHTKDIEPVLLWENPNPNSAFADQSVSLSQAITNFKYYKVVFIANNLSTENSHEKQVLTYFSYSDGAFRMFSTNGSDIFYRYAKFTNGTTINFADGKTNTTTDNYRCIPLAIYGTNVL